MGHIGPVISGGAAAAHFTKQDRHAELNPGLTPNFASTAHVKGDFDFPTTGPLQYSHEWIVEITPGTNVPAFDVYLDIGGPANSFFELSDNTGNLDVFQIQGNRYY